MFSIIAAIGKNRELGKDNRLIFNIKEDMQFFKETTMGHPVIMGQATYESIGHPLPGRKNYVASLNPRNLPDSVEVIPDLIAFLKKHQNDSEELFVIGGATIYRLALPYAKNLYLTEIDATAEADAFFPEFDKSKYSRKLIKKGSENDLTFSFIKYQLK
ncbi:dihydrofolate reductase [Candidatus Saccharibacteria bacterium]|nr:dihydrofolate reductase [Candidatus Saccharibacteria bacterium]